MVEDIPRKKLYTLNQEVFATLIGGPLGGALLVSQNYRQSGAARQARLAIVVGLLVTVALPPIALVLPEWVPRFALPLAYTIAFRELAKHLQQDQMKSLAEEEGERRTWRVTVGVSLLALVAMVALYAAMVMVWAVLLSLR